MICFTFEDASSFILRLNSLLNIESHFSIKQKHQQNLKQTKNDTKTNSLMEGVVHDSTMDAFMMMMRDLLSLNGLKKYLPLIHKKSLSRFHISTLFKTLANSLE